VPTSCLKMVGTLNLRAHSRAQVALPTLQIADSIFKEPRQTRVHVPRRHAPELCQKFPPFENRGRGECRCPMHPQPGVRWGSEVCTPVFTAEAPDNIRHSPRNGFTAYGVLSPATNSSCHRRRRIVGLARPVGLSKDLRRLDTSNGCQDHTLLPSASASLVLRVCRSLTGFHPPCDPVSRATLPRPPHLIPTFVTIASRPSWGMRWQ
jgi:hypothetical protein